MRTITLNIIKGYGLTPVLNVSQFDKGYTVTATVQKGAEAFTPPTGSTATVEGRKPDGTGYQYPATIDGSTVTFTMAEQMTVLSGRSMAEIVFYDADAVRIGTANFFIIVEAAPLNEETVISDTDIPAIIDAANANAERAEDAADEAEATLANFAAVVAEQVEQMQIHEGQTVIDGTLTVSGAAADAKVTGDEVAELKNDLDDTVLFFNWLDHPATVIPNTNINTTTGAKSANSAFTLYVMPYNGETLYINQCSDNLKKVILCSDANADNVLGSANDDGFTSWNSYYTSTITGATYIAIAVKSNYYDTALVIEKDNYALWSNYKRKITGDTYIKPLAELTDEVDIVEAQIETSKNLFDFTTLSDWGSWVNYTNGQIQSNQYVTTFAYSDFIEVEPDTAYTTQHGSRGIAFYDANKTYISGVNTNTFTTPETCKYIRMNVAYTDQDCCYTMLLKRSTAISNSEVYIPPYYGFEKPKRNYITCGTGGDYPTIKQGLEVATALDVDCVIMPGTYDLVSEGISGKGYTLPKRTYGYGATLVCRLSEEDWNLSPLNVSVYSTGAEVYGLTVICANCRYCIHDDMGAMVKQSYHNVFKDLHLIHESEISETLLAPQCIGGGFGLEGSVDIENCIFEATIRDVSYHSASGGTQRAGCILTCRDSVFSHTYTSTNVGTSTSFMNTSYVCGCKMATLPNTTPTANTQIIEWNNVVPA